MAVAGDVPRHFDVVINGEGYMFMEAGDQLGESGYSPLFIDRQNTQGAYGDAQFDFWLTYSQNDWSLGAFQRYVRTTDQDSKRQFWLGKKVDTSRPGQVSISRATKGYTAAAAVLAVASAVDRLYFATGTNLYSITGNAGAVTDHGAHGTATSVGDIVVDGSQDLYISDTSADANSIRKFDLSGSSFADWSGAGSDSLVFLNNTLYGYRQKSGKFYSYASDGIPTELHQFRGADAATAHDGIGPQGKLVAFGPKLILMLTPGPQSGSSTNASGMVAGFNTELWEYNGVGLSRIMTMPRNFIGWDMEVMNGSLFVSGHFIRHGSGGTNFEYKPAIYVVSGGERGEAVGGVRVRGQQVFRPVSCRVGRQVVVPC